jgi:predicted MPP superfamily phosphohydrolase
MRKRLPVFLAIVQSVLLLSHWFVYETWVAFRAAPDPPGISMLAFVAVILAVTFPTATLLAWRYSNGFARAYYKAAAVWLGSFSFLFFAAISSWILYGLALLSGASWDKRCITAALFGVAILTSLYGVINAAVVRVKRVTIQLPNLPHQWRGRVAALVTDMHLGHVRGDGFTKRIVKMLGRCQPDIVLIGGDMYDGTAADVGKLAAPFKDLSVPMGTYFVEGNHEEFSDHTKYLDAVRKSGVRVLNNEKVDADGLQIVGVHYRDAADPERLRGILRRADLDANRASILLTHAPNQLWIAAEEKIGLQLSGHTHAGQFFPFTWITSRIYGRFVYGLQRLGDMFVYTSCGVGTWGPPMRVGTRPEIVLIRLES